MENLVTVSTTAFSDIKDGQFKQICLDIVSTINNTIAINAEKTRLLSIQLASITPEMYKSLNYKSLEEFAEDRFKIKHSLAYSLAAAGTMYKDNRLDDAVKDLSPSKLVELKKSTIAAPKGIQDALINKVNEDAKSGKLGSMSQKDLRAYAAENVAEMNNKATKPKTVKMYHAIILHDTESASAGEVLTTFKPDSNLYTAVYENDGTNTVSKEDVDSMVKNHELFKCGEVEIDKMNYTRYVLFHPSGYPVAFILKEYKPVKVKAAKAKKTAIDIDSMTPEQAAAMIELLKSKVK